MNNQDVIVYIEQLKSYANIGVAIIVFILVVFSISFCLFKKIGCLKDKAIQIGFVLLLTIAVIVFLTSVLPYHLDIRQQSFIEYCGDFYVEDYYVTRSGTYILIKTDGDSSIRYKASSNLVGIEKSTAYNGKFVIAKHSKILLDITT